MKTIILIISFVLLPSLASAQITMYRPNGYGGTLYQFGPSGTSITTTLPNGYGGFNQYHFGPGRAPQFVQPLPTYNYAPPPMYYRPYAPRWNYGFRTYYGGGMW